MDPPASGRAGEGAETHTHTPAAASGEGGEAGGRREGGRGGGEDAHARPAPSRRPRRAPRRPRPRAAQEGGGRPGAAPGACPPGLLLEAGTRVRAPELPSRPAAGVAPLPSAPLKVPLLLKELIPPPLFTLLFKSRVLLPSPSGSTSQRLAWLLLKHQQAPGSKNPDFHGNIGQVCLHWKSLEAGHLAFRALKKTQKNPSFKTGRFSAWPKYPCESSS